MVMMQTCLEPENAAPHSSRVHCTVDRSYPITRAVVQELVSMIKNPGPFIAAGARLPSGLLMVGPPGTGKTLMARVMASEAGVPVR